MIIPNIYALPEILSASDNDYFIVADSSDNFNNKKILKSNINIDSSSGGNSYSLPIASESSLGGIKVGLGLNIDANGVLSIIDVSTIEVTNGLTKYDNNIEFGGTLTKTTELNYRALSFNIGIGFDEQTLTLLQQTDSKILVGGMFTSYNGTPCNYITRLNLDGTIDASFNIGTGFFGSVNHITQQTDGKILVVGGFISYNGTPCNYITRLNLDGTIDASFNIGTGFDITPASLLQQLDGKILVGGGFTSYNGTPCNRITRLNIDGTIDASFNTGTGFNDYMFTMLQQKDGKILVGGGFTSYNGTSCNYITRLNTDGTIDASFNTGTGFNRWVDVITQQTDGKILVGGDFTSYNGTPCNRITRLNIDGTIDASFNTGTGFNDYMFTMLQQKDGKILVGGIFTSYNGTSCNYITRLNTDGTIDASFNTGTGFDNFVIVITQQKDGKILVGGMFTSYNETSCNYITRLNTDGTIDDYVINNLVNFKQNTIDYGQDCSAYYNDRSLVDYGFVKAYVSSSGGSYSLPIASDTSLGGIKIGDGLNIDASGVLSTSNIGNIDASNGLTKIGNNIEFGGTLTKTTELNYFNSGFNIGSGFNNYVQSIIEQNDGKILVVGDFTSYNDTSINYIARLNNDGTIDASFNIGTGFDGGVWSLIEQTDGKILVGGDFTSYNETNVNSIVRLNNDGTIDASFNIGTGFNNYVQSLIEQTDGKILVGGGFTSYNDTSINYIARLNNDGTIDASFNIGTGFNNHVQPLIEQTDGKILVGGGFTSYNETNVNSIVRLNNDGTIDASSANSLLIFNNHTLDYGDDYSSYYNDRSLVDYGFIKNLMKAIPLTNQTFTGQFNLSTNYEVYYNEYVLDASITPTISSSPLIGSAARLVIDASTSAVLNTTNLGTKLLPSDDFTIGKKNELIVYYLPEGLGYTITLLN